jgi:hypothetical protein
VRRKSNTNIAISNLGILGAPNDSHLVYLISLLKGEAVLINAVTVEVKSTAKSDRALVRFRDLSGLIVGFEGFCNGRLRFRVVRPQTDCRAIFYNCSL